MGDFEDNQDMEDYSITQDRSIVEHNYHQLTRLRRVKSKIEDDLFKLGQREWNVSSEAEQMSISKVLHRPQPDRSDGIVRQNTHAPRKVKAGTKKEILQLEERKDDEPGSR